MELKLIALSETDGEAVYRMLQETEMTAMTRVS